MRADIATNEELRAELPIPFVLECYGHRPVLVEGERLHYVNPWREDTSPSLDVFTNDEGVQRAGDYAEGFQGSVLDIIGRQLETADFREIMVEARLLYARFLEEGWDGPSLSSGPKRKGMDPQLVDHVMSPRQNPTRWEGLDDLTSRPALASAREWCKRFKIHLNNGKLVVPYPDGQAIRLRLADGSKRAVPGSKFNLYHRPDLDWSANKPVLLVEGESDTWAAEMVVGDTFHVVGVPGVGHQPGTYLDQLEGRAVAIAFDGDQAGRAGAARWSTALVAAGCQVTIVALPDGRDVASLNPAALRELVADRRPSMPDTSGLTSDTKGYGFMTVDKEGEVSMRYISNWVARPVRRLVSLDDETSAYEVEVLVSGEPVHQTFVLTPADTGGQTKLHRWAHQFGGGWFGGSVDHAKLFVHITAQAAFVPVDRATNRPGLHGRTFAYPGGSIGQEGQVRVVSDPRLPMSEAAAYRLEPGDAGPSTVHRLMEMHAPEVMQPILAWLAIAPLRSLLPQFPPLMVTGRAGSGKTTIVDNSVSIFSGVLASTNLTSTTPYALTLTMGGTNAFPTWFDEYRPGAKRNTMEMMNQLLRDAYNGAVSRRGGLSENKSDITAIQTTNPLIVVGEDFADEQSHRDRLIKVFVPREGKGNLPLWTPWDHAFAHHYLTWLTTRRHGIDLAPVEDPPEIDGSRWLQHGITERQAFNLGVLDAGWGLLQEYVDTYDPGRSLGRPDWSLMLQRSVEESHTDPVLEALQFIVDLDDIGKIAFVEGDQLYINADLTLAELRKTQYPLPFNSGRAFSNYLLNELGGTAGPRRSVTPGGRQRRYICLDIPWDRE